MPIDDDWIEIAPRWELSDNSDHWHDPDDEDEWDDSDESDEPVEEWEVDFMDKSEAEDEMI